MSVIKKRIGIVGGGQLGKMMILEAKRLGFFVAIVDPTADCPAHSISDVHIVGGLDEAKAINELAKLVDVITYESEHINTDALEALEKEGHIIYPSVKSLQCIQNKFLQKQALKRSGLPVPKFEKVASVAEIKALADSDFGYPIMLKATTGGYDGKGNALIRSEAELESAFKALGGGSIELMAEAFVDFAKEISLIACRGVAGTKVLYPLAENIHKNSILDISIVPARVSERAIKKAEEITDKIMDVFEGVGIFCAELFLTAEEEIYVNEVAPRPHNSGHYTIEGCFASQFENHIRAIVGLPFGCTELISPTVMVNLLGESDGEANLLGAEEAYLHPNVKIHLYGKFASKTARKMGHFTVRDKSLEAALSRAEGLKKIVRIVGE